MFPLLQSTCLHPKYSLRRQLLQSFGVTAFVTLTLVAVMAVLFTAVSNDVLRTTNLLTEQVIHTMVTSSKYTAERCAGKMADIEGVVHIMAETVMDRIVGYPHEGWETDEHVPFFDKDSQRNVYPLRQKPVPLDWQVKDILNVNVDNIQEHFQERTWVQGLVEQGVVSTASASYRIQGACDPDETNPLAPTYYANCTDENNNQTTGGKIQPTPTNKGLYERTGDLGTFLKPLFEAENTLLTLDVAFVNSGAGSLLSFPGYMVNGNDEPYRSEGCEWMITHHNPLTGKPFATQTEVDRCHRKGEYVSHREYNPMERTWCKEFALNKPDEFSWHGPFMSYDTGMIILIVGRAVFDRLTNEFIGCVSVSLRVKELNEFLNSTKLNDTELAIVRYDDGRVLADTLGTHHDSSKIAEYGTNITVVQSGLIDEDHYRELIGKGLNANNDWSPVVHCHGGIFTAHPVPLPPADDTDYRPDMFVLHFLRNSNKAMQEIEEAEDEITDDLWWVALYCLFSGIIGMLLVFIIVWFVSRALTRPLVWIEKVAWNIVYFSDERADKQHLKEVDQEDFTATVHCAPTTEISTLVSEFKSMISGFSGVGASTVAEPPMHEVLNEVIWRSDYRELYQYDGARKSFRSNITPVTPATEEESKSRASSTSQDKPMGRSERVDFAPLQLEVPPDLEPKTFLDPYTKSIVPAPPKRNENSNFPPRTKSKEWAHHHQRSDSIVTHRSLLFWWILLLIVLPLVITNGVICTIVSLQVADSVERGMDGLADASWDLELRALEVFVDLKASYFEMNVQQVARDIHFMNRMAGWLLFDGIERADTLTDLEEATEECKLHPQGKCPFLESDRAFCECQWNDQFTNRTCTNSANLVARSRQRGFFALQARDADPETGARLEASSFFLDDKVDRSPSTTLWRNNTVDIPGSQRGEEASGYVTSYDRIRVASAMAVAFVPIYNYVQDKPNRRTHDLGSYIVFSQDGGITGLSGGCSYTFTDMAHFVAGQSEANNRPELCPVGRYGFDARCRGWYADGVSRYEKDGLYTYVTPPYAFMSNTTATSATSPILNPETNVSLGQLLYDFYQDGICRSLEALTLPLSFVITPHEDENGGDTVVGPPTDNMCESWQSASIGDLIFSKETFPPDVNKKHREFFDNDVLVPLKSGVANHTKFNRERSSGKTEELTLVYAPVKMRVLAPLSTTDFSRGVKQSTSLVYIVALGCNREALRGPYQDIKTATGDDIHRLRMLYDIFVCFVSVLFIIFSYFITVNVTKPILLLLQAVQSINDGKIEDDMPPMPTGSREMHQIYSSFAKLYKIVRMSNVAYFSGNSSFAYGMIRDALNLFRKVEDRKAVGVACNNLGNTLYAMIHQSREDAMEFEVEEKGCVATAALRYYDEAIEIAKSDFDEATDEGRKAEFAQQLADRYFNRGLLLLMGRTNESDVPNAKECALEDIARARNLDYDVKDFWMDRKLVLRNSDVYFDRLIRRLHGLIDHYEDEAVRSVWNAQQLAQEADRLLFAAWNEQSAPLFDSLTNVGRLQQLEGAVIRLDLICGRPKEAARLAMRMLCEDEYILETSLASAARAIHNLLLDEELVEGWSTKTKSCTKADLRRLLQSCKHVSLDLGKCFVFAIEINEKWEGDPLFEKIGANCLRLFDKCFNKTDHLGIVAYTTQGDLNVELGMKQLDESRQRTALEMATTSTSDRDSPSLPYAMQILVDSEATLEDDSYILLIADGESYEPHIFAKTRMQIERLNQERRTSIHVIILSVELEEEEVVEACKALCSVSKKSTFIEVDESNVDSAFDAVAGLITGSCLAHCACQGLTMEKF